MCMYHTASESHVDLTCSILRYISLVYYPHSQPDWADNTESVFKILCVKEGDAPAGRATCKSSGSMLVYHFLHNVTLNA